MINKPNQNITITLYLGVDVLRFIDVVSKMRIEIFREFPYLYEGNLNYEMDYMVGYARHPEATLAVATTPAGEIVGVSTGIPLASDSPIVKEVKEAFDRRGIISGQYYYFGEVLVLPQYRGRHLVSRMYKAQEDFAASKGYQYASILTVIRDGDHPLKPRDYHSHDNMWQHLGFFRNNLNISFHWPTIQPDARVVDEDNPMEFWVKNLSPPK